MSPRAEVGCKSPRWEVWLPWALAIAIVVATPFIIDRSDIEEAHHCNNSGAVRPLADGSVSQVENWISEQFCNATKVKYHQWFNLPRNGRHFTGVSCTFHTDHGAQSMRLLFQLEPLSGHVDVVVDLDSGMTIVPGLLDGERAPAFDEALISRRNEERFDA